MHIENIETFNKNLYTLYLPLQKGETSTKIKKSKETEITGKINLKKITKTQTHQTKNWSKKISANRLWDVKKHHFLKNRPKNWPFPFIEGHENTENESILITLYSKIIGSYSTVSNIQFYAYNNSRRFKDKKEFDYWIPRSQT